MKKNYIVALVTIGTLLSVASGAFAGDIVRLDNPLAPAGVTSIPILIEKITQFVSGIVGTLASLMFVISGIMFVTAGGSSERIGKAKKTAIYAGVGLIIAVAGTALAAVIRAAIG